MTMTVVFMLLEIYFNINLTAKKPQGNKKLTSIPKKYAQKSVSK